jgi:hypothetical protein
MGYRHAGDARYLPDVAIDSPYRFEPNLIERGWQLVRGIVQFLRARSILGIDDHQIIEYCRKLDHIAQARTQAVDECSGPQSLERRQQVEHDGATHPVALKPPTATTAAPTRTRALKIRLIRSNQPTCERSDASVSLLTVAGMKATLHPPKALASQWPGSPAVPPA